MRRTFTSVNQPSTVSPASSYISSLGVSILHVLSISCCLLRSFLAAPSDNQQTPVSPQGTTSLPYTFNFADMESTTYAGGSVKIADSRNFKVAKQIAVAEVTVEPGSMRELHVSRNLASAYAKLISGMMHSGTRRTMSGPTSCEFHTYRMPHLSRSLSSSYFQRGRSAHHFICGKLQRKNV